MKNWLYIAFTVFLFASCVGEKWKENPVDDLIEKYKDKGPVSIILKDMDLQDGDYFHKYMILYSEGGEFKVDSTEWMEVNENFFILNEENLDMSIVAIDEKGNIDKLVAPPGYRHIVGNEKYGRWEDRNGQRVWVFLGQYYFYRTIFGWGGRPLYYNSYNTYRTSYYGSRPYYGSKGNEWGTSSKYTQSNRPNFYKRKTSKNNFMSRKRSSGFFSRSGSSGFRKGGGSGK
ncbi:MAG: hypothetical protein KDC84_12865 [Crocinitomicaceae bacterium]|nr:hypothetical protein [Crocinitomicaceae bacterium]